MNTLNFSILFYRKMIFLLKNTLIKNDQSLLQQC
jgi:hypothetical protein